MSKLSDILADRMVERYENNVAIKRRVDKSSNFFDGMIRETEIVFNLEQIKKGDFYGKLVESIAERT